MNLSGQNRDYSVPEKKKWRREYYREIVRLLPEQLAPSRARILMLPGKSGLEIREALMYGFREENIAVVDRNPAVVAFLRRRFPRLGLTLGCELTDAAARVRSKDWKLDVLSIDLCCQLNASVMIAMVNMRMEHVLNQRFLFAFNILRGREQGFWKDILRGRPEAWDEWWAKNMWSGKPFSSMDHGRLGGMLFPFIKPMVDRVRYRFDFNDAGGSSYVSDNGQSFMWRVIRFTVE